MVTVLLSDESGSISEFEFLKFFLCKTEMVDADILDELHQQFHAADLNGSGRVSVADLEHLEEIRRQFQEEQESPMGSQHGSEAPARHSI